MNDCDKRIIGIVLDQDTNEPIPFATVMIVNSTTGTVSQEDGTFILEGICENEIDFEVRFVGFKAVTHHHDFRNGQQVAKDHIVYLASVNTELESITVENERLDELKSLAIQNKELSSISRLGTSIV
ncbi:MAG: carboxypeptidase-like regulatory domain-containing protein, partial [Cyclobacteriaceae bacterium]